MGALLCSMYKVVKNEMLCLHWYPKPTKSKLYNPRQLKIVFRGQRSAFWNGQVIAWLEMLSKTCRFQCDRSGAFLQGTVELNLQINISGYTLTQKTEYGKRCFNRLKRVKRYVHLCNQVKGFPFSFLFLSIKNI